MIRRLLLLAAAVSGSAVAAPSVHFDQLGFQPNAAKRAIVANPAPSPLPWVLIDAQGKVAARGVTAVFGDDRASGDHVHRIDFSTVQAPGRYTLQVAGETSRPFAIAPAVFRPLAGAALNYFYQTRAGTPIEAHFAGGATWARAAGHRPEVAACFSGADERGTVWPGCSAKKDVTGGWYDAGDQGKYVVNGGIALWTLLNLYEALADHPPFPDGTAALPEAGNGANDLLDEARWEMRFMLAMQVPDGERMALPTGPQPATGPLRLTQVDAGGMAFHKVADRNWTKLPTAPAADTEERLLYPPSTAATLNLAATAAQGARIWRTIDPAFAARCLAAATRAYDAALRHPGILAAQAFTGSGGYGDQQVADEFYWATAELYATTQSPELLNRLRAIPLHRAPITEAPNWGSVAALGTMTLAIAPGVAPAEQAAARSTLVAAADRFLAEGQRSGYQIPFASTAYAWGSNAVILNRGIILGLAARFTGEARYRNGVVDTADYVLGRNPLGQSYVTGFGWNAMHNPHHRFWAHQFDAAMPGPPPGVLSGGPNNTAFSDEVARTLKGRCAPQRCWRDDARAFALNEVAINWNAPLLWVATWLDASEKTASGVGASPAGTRGSARPDPR